MKLSSDIHSTFMLMNVNAALGLNRGNSGLPYRLLINNGAGSFDLQNLPA